ncbi:MAG TPA: hypothetical protein VJ828_08720 [Lacipirellulaceae bacterium]|nr:hypothetical protein [Lacipirellulaceae bacterium]
MAAADIRDDYELTVAAAVKATRGWELYENEKFGAAFKGGHYTDPDPKTKVNDFWSDGLIAKLDRDNNGHFETIFIVVDDELVYAGSIGRTGRFVHTAKVYKNYVGEPAASFIGDSLAGRRKN